MTKLCQCYLLIVIQGLEKNAAYISRGTYPSNKDTVHKG